MGALAESKVLSVKEREKLEDHNIKQQTRDTEIVKEKEKRKRKLIKESTELENRGVCYLSRIPPHMTPLKLRQLLSEYGEILRIYLVPEDPTSRTHRKRAGGNQGVEFTEGWVEFAKKSVAKRVARMLNGEQIGGKRRSAHYYDIWNIKYLRKFNWDDLTGELALKRAVREQKLAMEVSAAKKERDFYLSKVEQSQAIKSTEKRVRKVVTDNAASFVAAGRILMASYPTIYWTPCAAHCLDLLLEDIGKINWISMVVRRAKIICKFIYMNSHVRHLFLEFSKGVEIVRPATTRFATNFILLESIQSHKGNLMNMFVSEKYRNDERFARARRLPMGKVAKRAIWDETQFWHGVRNCILITEPLVKVLRIVDGERPSMGFVYEAMERAKDAIKAYMSASRQESDWAHISSLIDKRWNENLHSDLHAAAHVLNPKFGFGKSLLGDAELASGVTNVFHKLESDSRRTIKLMNDLNHYRKKDCPQFLHSTAELAKNEMAPEDWWLAYGTDVPTLQQLAIRILTQPCSASGCERNWSVFEHIHSKKRNKLTAERLNDLVFVHYNLKLKYNEVLMASSSYKRPEGDEIDLDNIHVADPLSEWLTVVTNDAPEPSPSHDYATQAQAETPPVHVTTVALREPSPVIHAHPQSSQGIHSQARATSSSTAQEPLDDRDDVDVDDDSDDEEYLAEEETEMARDDAQFVPSHDDLFTEEELLKLEEDAENFATSREETSQAFTEAHRYRRKLKTMRGGACSSGSKAKD